MRRWATREKAPHEGHLQLLGLLTMPGHRMLLNHPPLLGHVMLLGYLPLLGHVMSLGHLLWLGHQLLPGRVLQKPKTYKNFVHFAGFRHSAAWTGTSSA